MALIALLPIALLIFLLTKRNSLPSHTALWITAGLTYLLSLIAFARDPLLVHASVIDGFLTSWTPILIIWGAIFLFESLEAGGGMSILRRWLNGVSSNRVAQLMIVGWAFPFLIEGASGFGTPAALAAPILVGLGFPAMKVAVMALIMNSVPVSFGAVGTPTWFGFSGIANLSAAEITEIGIKSAMLHGAAALFVPIAALLFVVEWKQIRANLIYIYLVIAATVIPYIATAFFSYEFPSLVGGLVGLLASVFLAQRGVGLRTAGEDASSSGTDASRVAANAGNSAPSPDSSTIMASAPDQPDSGGASSAVPPTGVPATGEPVRIGELLRASFPVWGTVLVLVLTRIPQLPLQSLLRYAEGGLSVQLGALGRFGVSPAAVLSLTEILGTTEAWSHQLLYVPSLIPFALVAIIYLGRPKLIGEVFSKSTKRMRNPALSLFAALIFVNLMLLGGTDSAVALIGGSLASITGSAWQVFAAFLGALGSFFSGSNTVSNLTFGGIQDAAASALGLNRTTMLSLQSVGGALGNMICINNIVAVASVLGLEKIEGYALKRTVLVAVPYALLAGALSYVVTLIV